MSKNETFIKLTGLTFKDIRDYLYDECNMDRSMIYYETYKFDVRTEDGVFFECHWKAHNENVVWVGFGAAHLCCIECPMDDFGHCIDCGEFLWLDELF